MRQLTTLAISVGLVAFAEEKEAVSLPAAWKQEFAFWYGTYAIVIAYLWRLVWIYM